MAKRLFVGNLPYKVDHDQLRDIFAAAGEVTEARVWMKKDNPNLSAGYGFVEMATDEAAEKAVKELNGHDLDGRNLTVDFAKPRM